MPLTGIIRRIDELGRVVIPKEIRKELRIKNGENLEIYTENNRIIIKKHSPLNKISEISNTIAETLNITLKATIIISDTDKYISASGKNSQKYLDKNLSDELLELIMNNKSIIINEEPFKLIKDKEEKGNYLINPISINGDIYGAIIAISKEPLSKNDLQTVSLFSSFLAKYVE